MSIKSTWTRSYNSDTTIDYSTILHREVHHHREVHQPPRYPYLGYVSMHAG